MDTQHRSGGLPRFAPENGTRLKGAYRDLSVHPIGDDLAVQQPVEPRHVSLDIVQRHRSKLGHPSHQIPVQLSRLKPAVKARFDEKGRSELHALRLVVFLPVLKKVIGSGVAGGRGVFETGSASEAPSAPSGPSSGTVSRCPPSPAASGCPASPSGIEIPNQRPPLRRIRPSSSRVYTSTTDGGPALQAQLLRQERFPVLGHRLPQGRGVRLRSSSSQLLGPRRPHHHLLFPLAVGRDPSTASAACPASPAGSPSPPPHS